MARRPVVAGGAVVLVAGLALAGVGFVMSRQSSALSQMAVTSPGAGMVATAEGDGTGTPTHIDAAAGSLGGIGSSGSVPVRPDLYLEQQSVTGPTGNVARKEAAWWRVWWDSGTQTEDVVSLQAHLNASDASSAVAQLDARNRDPAALASGQPSDATLSSTFAVPGIPGSDGYIWTVAPPSGFVHNFYFAVFARGSVTALVSVDGLTGSSASSVGALDSFARDEYAAMGSHGPGPALVILGIVLAGVGTLALALAARRAPTPAAGVTTPGAWTGGPPPPYGPVGAAPFGTGGPPPYGRPPPPYGPVGAAPFGTGGPPPYGPAGPSPYGVAGPPGATTVSVQVEPPAPPPLHAVIGRTPPVGGADTTPVTAPPPLVPPTTSAAPTVVAAEQAPATPAGWYPEPGSQPPMLRYWDGTAWTAHRAPATGG
ncbi:MAG: DUF2510 domain-containing protein [Actinomycetota bacterium]|jgi:hypothetical protein|nr:DUF2510 domain-containing protein [Actinomycetota bacterium]